MWEGGLKMGLGVRGHDMSGRRGVRSQMRRSVGRVAGDKEVSMGLKREIWARVREVRVGHPVWRGIQVWG